MTRQEIKERSKQQLGRNIFGNTWLMALVVCLIQGAIIGLASGISSFIGGAASLIVMGPLAFGISFIFLKLVRNNDGQIDIKDIFKGFTEDFGGNLLLEKVVAFRATDSRTESMSRGAGRVPGRGIRRDREKADLGETVQILNAHVVLLKKITPTGGTVRSGGGFRSRPHRGRPKSC